MKIYRLIFAISAILFAVSCSDLKFNNPNDINSGANDNDAAQNDADTETSDDDANDPEIDPEYFEPENNRIVIQLGWKQGFKSKAESGSQDGVLVDLDLHLVKKSSIEAAMYKFDILDGLLGTKQRRSDFDCPLSLPECEYYWRHDDCSFGDQGFLDDYIEESIAWNAKFAFDNFWGGGNYTNPETIIMGPTADLKNNTTGENEPDGYPDAGIPDDQYLVVVTYSNCESSYSDGEDRCDSHYHGDDSAVEVDARVKILVDGAEVPREGIDHYYETTKDFTIKFNEWKVVAVIKWDSSLKGPNPMLKGNAIISDTYLPEHGIEIDPVRYPVCVYDNADANLVPVWDRQAYIDHITTTDPETNIKLGKCYDPEEPENPYTGDKRKAVCENLPKNADWNQVSEIVQEWNGHNWVPSVEGTFSEEPSDDECRFKCKDNYSWDGSKCAADQRREPCGTLPVNALWNDDGNEGYYTQTWTGEEGGWQPQFVGIAYSDTPGECIFNCLEGYSWNGTACEPSPDMLPECGPGSETPCKDSTMGFIWSAKGTATYENAITICNNLNYAGYGGFNSGWYLPTISELRTLIKDCPGTILPGGTCEVREDNDVNCLGKVDYDCQGESCYSCTGDPDGGYSKFGETGWFWSSSANWDDPDNSAWGVGFQGADVYSNAKSETNYARCIRRICDYGYYWNGSSCQSNTRSASCPSKPENTQWNDDGLGGTFIQTYDIWEGAWGPESRNTIYSQNSGECHYKCANNYLWNYNSECEYYTAVLPECSQSSGTPCYDPSNGLTWSGLVSEMTWDEAAEYCPGHTEGDLNGWSLPNINELRTLIQNCPGSQRDGDCAVSYPDYLAYSDWSDICYCNRIENNDGYYSKLGDDDTVVLWSSSVQSDNPDGVWSVEFAEGYIVNYDKNANNNFRCVKR